MPLPRLPALATRAPRCVAALALVLPLLAMAQSAPAPTSVPTTRWGCASTSRSWSRPAPGGSTDRARTSAS